jgi:anti-sigma factor RsiW
VKEASALDHDHAARLLPWLVNGTLEAAERFGVEQHVRSCIACRRELKELERLGAAVRAQPLVQLSADSGLARLEEQLDDEAAAQGSSRRALSYPPFLRYAAAASIGVAILGALLWLAPSLENRSGYSTLASSPTQRRAQIDLIFTEQTSAADIQALLTSIDGEIVAGPTELGRYGIRVHGGQADDKELAALLERLARDTRVRFAGRSFGEGER